MVHPIIDEYYNYNPYHRRSSKFVHDKGLITNEKGNPNNPASPITTPGISLSLDKTLENTATPLNGQHFNTANPHHSMASTLVPSTHGPISPTLTPARENSPLRHHIQNQHTDIRQITALHSLRSQDRLARPQEQGNVGKKRVAPEREEASASEPETAESIRATAYGDPLKIAQYFPELN
jgi:glutamine amidotransferase